MMFEAADPLHQLVEEIMLEIILQPPGIIQMLESLPITQEEPTGIVITGHHLIIMPL